MFFAKATTSKTGEVYIYEDIGEGFFGGLSAKKFSDEMKKVGSVSHLDIYINSPGGSVFEGLTIYNQLRRHPANKTVYVDGIAASIASVIMLAGDTVKIAENGTVMIHDPWGFGVGNAQDLRKVAESLDQVRDQILDTYVARTGNKREEVEAWMAAETWFKAPAAKEAKFVTEIVKDRPIQNSSSTLLAKFKNTPDALRTEASSVRARLATMDMGVRQIRRASPEK